MLDLMQEDGVRKEIVPFAFTVLSATLWGVAEHAKTVDIHMPHHKSLATSNVQGMNSCALRLVRCKHATKSRSPQMPATCGKT